MTGLPDWIPLTTSTGDARQIYEEHDQPPARFV
jgi:hypothetical protein